MLTECNDCCSLFLSPIFSVIPDLSTGPILFIIGALH